MAAAGTSPALNLREKLAELAGLKQRVSPDLVRRDFTNLVTNGTFDTDTDWTKGTGWTIGSGVATHAAGTASSFTQSVLVGGRYYSSTITISNRTLGTVFSSFGNGTLLWPSYTSNATSTVLGVSTGTIPSNFAVYSTSDFDGDVDNVSLYEADPSDDAPWLRLPYGYKVGQRGMIVRDGVVLHPSDYTEITDSGQTWIKPITAPGVSTEFSIGAGA